MAGWIMKRTIPIAIAMTSALLVGCVGAPRALAAPLASGEALSTEYREWLDQARTPARAVDFVLARSPGWTVIDALATEPRPVRPGDRLMFVDRGRSVLLVVIGQDTIARAGARLIAAHIDTPSPRLSLVAVEERNQLQVKAFPYGGMRAHHWLHMPLAVVGRVARAGNGANSAAPDEIDVTLGLDDDFALYATERDHQSRALIITASSTPPAGKGKDSERAAATLMSVLHQRYGLTAADVQAAELFLVPKHKAREVGVDRALIGAHGQDDRANSYLAWRAIMDMNGTPRATAMVWLIDREEVGSFHPAGATSRMLELVFAYLLRAQASPATEAVMGRAFHQSLCISADTPAGLNPNWPEVHDERNAPVLGKGPALFPYTGHGGKEGGSAASAELIRQVAASFDRAGVPLQYGLLGRVDEGGGGTVAKYLAERGISVVDLGVAAVSLHSPLELTAKDDLWAAYLGFRAWLVEP
jgi:aspartyl aminopeptidase